MASFRDNFNLLFSRRDQFRFAVLVVLMIGGTFLELASLGAVPLFVAMLAGQGDFTHAGQLGKVALWLGLSSGNCNPVQGGLLLGTLFLIRTIYLTMNYFLQERILKNRQLVVSSRLFRAYMSAPYAFHLHHNSSVIITNVTTECERVTLQVLESSMNALRGVIVMMAVVVLLVWQDPLVCMGAFVALGVFGGGFMLIMNKRIGRWGWLVHVKRQDAIKCIGEGIGAYKEAQMLGKRGFFCDRLHHCLEEECRKFMFLGLFQKSMWPYMELITVSVLLGAMCVMLLLRGDDVTTVAPTMALIAVCLARLKGTLTEFMLNLSSIKSTRSVMDTICDDLRELEAIPVQDEHMPDMPFGHGIQCQNVDFKYDGAEKLCLRNVDLDIGKGQSIALVGPTGSGKTTLISILLGLLPPTRGKILVDGTDIAERLPAWRRHLGYVAQDIFLLDDTIRANVALGVAADDVDEQALRQALEASQLDEFVKSLPDGDRTLLGERGMRLSGGQRQRVAIARALYRNPQVLFFDEATSSLDMTTERAVVEAIERLRGDHTLVIVAHRLSTVRHCDRLVYLDHGEIVASGTYEELKMKLPEFRQMAEAN